jgi:hypothetical protein
MSDRQSGGSATDSTPIPEEGFASCDDSHDLQLHMALSAGDISMFNPLSSYGSIHFRSQVKSKYSHNPIQIIISKSLANIIIGNKGDDDAFNNLLTQETGRLEYAICGEQMSAIDDALNMARAGEVTVTKCAWKYVNPDSYPCSEPRRNCFILRNNQPDDNIETPLLRKVRNDSLLNGLCDVNPNYYK